MCLSTPWDFRGPHPAVIVGPQKGTLFSPNLALGSSSCCPVPFLSLRELAMGGLARHPRPNSMPGYPPGAGMSAPHACLFKPSARLHETALRMSVTEHEAETY